MNRTIALISALAALSACNGGYDYGEDFEGDRVFSGCDPLDEGLCALPFPSDYFTVPADTPTGKRVNFWDGSDCADYDVDPLLDGDHPIFDNDVDGPESVDPCVNSLPVNRNGAAVKPHFLNELDGFSPNGTILVYLEDVQLDGVINNWDLERYTDADAKTVILDPDGNRVPHFVELDMTAENPNERLLMLRPVVPLAFGTTYTVGLRNLLNSTGDHVRAYDGFAWLRDGDDWAKLDRRDFETSWDIESRREHYDAHIFPQLETAGFPRQELQNAWQFTTASREATLGRIEFIRDDMMSRLPAGGPAYTITRVEDESDACSGESPPHIGKTVYADLTLPYYTETDEPGTMLSRDETGMPFFQGETTSEVMVRIPCSVILDPKPSRVLQYGHGLLGDKGEGRTGWLSEFANERGYVIFAMDWKGMSEDDVNAITEMLVFDISEFSLLPERSQQGISEWVAAAKAMKGDLGADAEFVLGGQNIIDPTDVVYYGNSQGGIMGGAYMGLTTEVTRGVLGVPGSPYAILLQRSVDFDPFFLVFKNQFDDHREISLGIAMMQMPWDPAEASGWMTSVNGPDTPEGMEPKEILLHVGIGDAQVTPLGAHIQARAYGAKTVAPQTRPIFGIEEASGPFTGSAIVEFEYLDVPEVPVTNTPPLDDSFDTHECPRRDEAGQAQIDHFFETGEYMQFCEGEGCIQESSEWCR